MAIPLIGLICSYLQWKSLFLDKWHGQNVEQFRQQENTEAGCFTFYFSFCFHC